MANLAPVPALPRDAAVRPEDRAERASANPLRLLAFVHLRNIHRSTGAGRVARQLTEHLAQRTDVDLEVLADPGDHTRIIPAVGSPWDQFRYRFIGKETSRQQSQWFLWNAPQADQYWPDAQVVFCTGESYVPKGKARLAITLHDAAYFEKTAHRFDLPFLKQRLKWRLLYRRLAARADLFHTVSHFSAERLAHFYPSIRTRIRVVHNAVTPHFFEPVTGPGRAYVKTAGLDEAPFVLVPGGLHFRKNAELILRAWPAIQESNPDLRLAVVNHSDPVYAARASALGNRVRVLGFVPDEALRALYAAAQVVWFPSRYEGFGLPVLEAMASGTPVVTAKASSLPEIAGTAACLVSPERASAHVEAIRTLLADSRLRQDLSNRGRSRASLFTWSRAAAELKSHFDSLL